MITIAPHHRTISLTVVLGLALTLLPHASGGGAALAQSPPSGSPPSTTMATTAKDPAALAILKSMCDRLAAARTFTVRGRASLELPLADGELATFFNDFDTAVRRPDGLAAHRMGDLQELRFVFDGKSMTVHVPGAGKWGTTSGPRHDRRPAPRRGGAGWP